MSTTTVRQLQEVELLREHFVNGRRFEPGIILTLPAACALNLIQAGAAKPTTPEPPTDD